MIAEEHELATGSQQTVRLANPGGGLTPDRRAVLADREIERAVRLGDRLRIAMHPDDVVSPCRSLRRRAVASWASELSTAYAVAPRRRIQADT